MEIYLTQHGNILNLTWKYTQLSMEIYLTEPKNLSTEPKNLSTQTEGFQHAFLIINFNAFLRAFLIQIVQQIFIIYIVSDKINNIYQLISYQICKSMESNRLSTIYEDAVVQITQDQIIIKKYYFPIPIDKNINFNQIDDIFLLSKNSFSKTLFNNRNQNDPFYPQQPYRQSYIQLWLLNSKSRPMFSPHDPKKVFRIIQDKLKSEQFKENVNTGLIHAKRQSQQIYSNMLNKLGQFFQNTSNKISQKGHQWSEQLKAKSNQQS